MFSLAETVPAVNPRAESSMQRASRRRGVSGESSQPAFGRGQAAIQSTPGSLAEEELFETRKASDLLVGGSHREIEPSP